MRTGSESVRLIKQKGGLFRFLLFYLLISLQACENDTGEVARITRPDLEPVERIRKLQTLYSDSGRVKVRVNAEELRKMPGEQPITELPKGLVIEFFDANLMVVSQLSAEYAIHYDMERKWIARNKVHVMNERKEELHTEELIWYEREGKISSDKFVRISTPEEVIYGEGFEADQDFSNYRIYKVKGRISVKK